MTKRVNNIYVMCIFPELNIFWKGSIKLIPSTEMIPPPRPQIWSSGREMKKDSHLFMYKT